MTAIDVPEDLPLARGIARKATSEGRDGAERLHPGPSVLQASPYGDEITEVRLRRA